MGFKPEDYDRLPDRMKEPADRRKPQVISPDAVKRELPLHDDIKKFCNERFPRWVYVHSNPTVAATVRPGTPDFIIFAPNIVLAVECKTKDGKLSPEQLAWKLEVERLGHSYHVVRCMDDLKKIIYDLGL